MSRWTGELSPPRGISRWTGEPHPQAYLPGQVSPLPSEPKASFFPLLGRMVSEMNVELGLRFPVAGRRLSDCLQWRPRRRSLMHSLVPAKVRKALAGEGLTL